jgi:hypothetical protein
MYNKEFWTKYTFRFLHMLSVISLGGKIIGDYMFPTQDESTTGSVYSI